MRGIMARKVIQDMRDEEMVFLGMERDKNKTRAVTAPGAAKSSQPMANPEDSIGVREHQKQVNKWIQAGNQVTYDKKKKELLREIKEVEGYDLRDKMLKERRDWIQE
jgi:hypothetical protein